MHNKRIHSFTLRRCTLVSRRNASGIPTYWGVQGDGWLECELVENYAADMFEHGFYLHNLGRGEMEKVKILRNSVEACQRTGLQIAGRDILFGGHAQPPDAEIVVQGNTFLNCSSYVASNGHTWGNGSAITCAGHMGQLAIVNNDVTVDQIGSDGKTGGGGGIVLWHDEKLGRWTSGGYAIPKARIKANTLDCPRANNGGRDVIMAGGVRELRVNQNAIEGRGAAGLQLNHRKKNGSNALTGPDRPSEWRGWGEQLQGKVRLGQQKPPHFLSDAEIDFLWTGTPG